MKLPFGPGRGFSVIEIADPHFIAIGASGSDGLADIKALLRHLPHPVAAVVLVVLHRPADHISHLREVLAADCAMEVVIAKTGERLRPGTCYIGEPAEHLSLAKNNMACLIDDPVNQLRNRTVDALLGTVAAHAGARAIGVILSGSLDDGSRGLAAIKAAGGTTMVLTPVAGRKGMPENAIDYDGPVDVIGTAEVISRAIGRRLAKGKA